MSAKTICKDCSRCFKYGYKDQKKKNCCNTIERPYGRFPKNVKECKLFNKKIK